ncbi:oxidoreductase [Streptomyces sulfonofaciens]|uniref:Oxidoreductase n=1 Tax=Streptomyces sulfonofaciens TaxID=68272 RepID=A0A919KYY2_9ACTN|nr:aldo/keto reductase [Streptomyces sulfonofaciens]GHH77817.1 oxidoreductase [Streptomyces sulfonofaciens]
MSTDTPATRPTPGTVTLGGDLTFGSIGYGAMQLTGPKFWGPYPDHAKGVALLREVVAQGVTFLDTADVYGPHSNEELVREALHPYPDDLVIATKGGFVSGGPGFTEMGAVGNRAYLRQAARMSLRRLGLDRIDLYYLHTPSMTDVPFEEAVETLAGLREEGVIRHIGLSNVSAAQLRTALTLTDIAAVTVPYNLAIRLGGPVRRVAEEHGIVFSPWRPTAIPTGEAGDAIRAAVEPIAHRHGATVQQIALAWQLHRTTNALPIPGTTDPAHLRENLAAAHVRLTQDEVAALTALAPEPTDETLAVPVPGRS